MRKFLAILSLVVMLSGCGTAAVIERLKANPDEELLAAVLTVAEADAQAAFEDATAHDDKIAAVCWQAIGVQVKLLQEKRNQPKQPNTGALLAIQKSRDALNSMNSGIPADLQIGCAALAQDMRKKGLELAAMIAAASHGVPPSVLGGLVR